MKFLSDLLPVLLFFVAYYVTRDMFIATGVAIAATAVMVGLAWYRHRRIETMQWVSLGLIVVLGGLTLLLHDKRFIMWKPTALYWAMAAGIAISEWGFGKSPLKAMMGAQMTLPATVWRKLALAWVAFFAAMGALNLFVAWTFSEEVWVNFKLFGGMGLMFAFVLAQGMALSRYIEDKS